MVRWIRARWVVCCAVGAMALGGVEAKACGPQVVVSSTAVVSPLVVVAQPQFVVQTVNVPQVVLQPQVVVQQHVLRQQVRGLGATRVVVRSVRCR